MRDDLPARIQDLLFEELGLYRALRTMVSRALEAIILDEDMEALLNILEEKQAPLSQIQLLLDSWNDVLSEAGIQEARGRDGVWERLRAALPEDCVGEFDRLLQETREAAEELVQAEARAQEELERRLAGLREKMASMTRGREAFIGYTKMGGNTFAP